MDSTQCASIPSCLLELQTKDVARQPCERAYALDPICKRRERYSKSISYSYITIYRCA